MPKQQQMKPAQAKPQKLPDDFISVAKRLKCDTDMGKFLKKLGKIARAKPQKPKQAR